MTQVLRRKRRKTTVWPAACSAKVALASLTWRRNSSRRTGGVGLADDVADVEDAVFAVAAAVGAQGNRWCNLAELVKDANIATSGDDEIGFGGQDLFEIDVACLADQLDALQTIAEVRNCVFVFERRRGEHRLDPECQETVSCSGAEAGDPLRMEWHFGFANRMFDEAMVGGFSEDFDLADGGFIFWPLEAIDNFSEVARSEERPTEGDEENRRYELDGHGAIAADSIQDKRFQRVLAFEHGDFELRFLRIAVAAFKAIDLGGCVARITFADDVLRPDECDCVVAGRGAVVWLEGAELEFAVVAREGGRCKLRSFPRGEWNKRDAKTGGGLPLVNNFAVHGVQLRLKLFCRTAATDRDQHHRQTKAARHNGAPISQRHVAFHALLKIAVGDHLAVVGSDHLGEGEAAEGFADEPHGAIAKQNHRAAGVEAVDGVDVFAINAAID